MKDVFLDTSYLVGVSVPGEKYHRVFVDAFNALGRVRLVTTEEVLSEYLNYFCEFRMFRPIAAQTVRNIQADPDVTIFHQTADSFAQGLFLYESRPDKEFSLTDCISMIQMREHGIHDILTSDHHFKQAGFNVLLKV